MAPPPGVTRGQSPFGGGLPPSPSPLPTTPGLPAGLPAQVPHATAPELKPTVTILEPVNGATINSTTLRVIIAFGGLTSEPTLFRVSIDGSDKTLLFTLTSAGASATIGPLPEGQHEITVAVSDQVGRGATVLSRFAIDLKFGDLSPIELGFARALQATEPVFSQQYQTLTQPARHPDASLLQQPLGLGQQFQSLAQQPATIAPQLRQAIPPQQLRQFGYDLFRTMPSSFGPTSDAPVGPDYILGPGDTLQAYMWGMVDNVLTLPVNQRGEIFLPKVGTLPVRGMALGDARRLIQEQLSRQFAGFRLSLSLTELRSVQTYVVGEVARPGVYTISSLSAVTNTLFASGGPTKLGSLRNISLIRQNRTIGTLDLYDFLLKGDRSRDFRVESGDTIFVPSIGPVVAITGNVKRPAIYELKGATRVHDVLQQMAGGVTPTGYLQRVQIERVKAHQERIVLDLDLSTVYRGGDAKSNVLLEEGDIIKIFPIDSKVYNAVNVEGFVLRPGPYELKRGMRLSELLRPIDVLPEAYLERVEVVRTRPDFTREVLATNLRELWRGDYSQDILLESQDQIMVSSETRALGAITLQGEVKRPGIYPIVQGERLSSALKRAGGYTDQAYLKGALFIRERLRVQQQEELERFIKTQEEVLLSESARTAAGSLELAGSGREEATLQQQSLQQRRQLLDLLRSKVILGRLVVKLDSPAALEGSPNDIPLEQGDFLTVPKQPSSVLVIGSVRNPTAVVYEEGRDVEYYLNRAGGLNKEADKDELHIVKADGSATAGFLKLRKIEAGDIIVAPAKVEAKVRSLPAIKDVATILGQFALTAGVLGALF
ncbi:MAG TPA: SLBB domain-containing protein [Candidatus Tectomicrobia bacterium]|nr:SLBB domain-containing protein [Candidatus Tectomicrobia bacterium]